MVESLLDMIVFKNFHVKGLLEKCLTYNKGQANRKNVRKGKTEYLYSILYNYNHGSPQTNAGFLRGVIILV
jgi:hypothetical protein